jgi:hypothetical protein
MKPLASPSAGFIARIAALSLLTVSVGRAESIDLYVMAGQSNIYGILGREELPSDLAAPQDIPFKFSMQYVPTRNFVSDGFIDLQPLSNLGPQYLLSTFASELTFGQAMRQQSARKIAILKVAANATTLVVDWNPAIPTSLYNPLTSTTNEAMIELADLGYQPSVKGVVWVQGENDAQTATDANNYRDNLSGFLDALRTEAFFSADVPVVVNQLHTATNIRFAATVRNAQAAAIAGRVDNVHLLNNDDLTLYVDGIHYSATMQLEVGKRLADFYLSVVPEPPAAQTGLLALSTVVSFRWRRVRDKETKSAISAS